MIKVETIKRKLNETDEFMRQVMICLRIIPDEQNKIFRRDADRIYIYKLGYDNANRETAWEMR